MADLTPRQQEIAALIEQGKDPKEIAKRLKISRNAVYQQLRRIREGGGARRSSGRSSARRRPRSSGGNGARPQHMTPLQAIRTRKGEIEAELRASRQAVEEAERAHKRAHEGHSKLAERHDEELRNLHKAEAALSGKTQSQVRGASRGSSRRRTRRQAPRKRRGGQKAQQGAQASS